jgi:hypothetical protein
MPKTRIETALLEDLDKAAGWRVFKIAAKLCSLGFPSSESIPTGFFD